MPKPLDDRIAAALGFGARLTTVAELIDEIDVAIQEVRDESARYDAISVSASVAEDIADKAADEAVKLNRKAIRLAAKRDQLEVRRAQLTESGRLRRERMEAEATS